MCIYDQLGAFQSKIDFGMAKNMKMTGHYSASRHNVFPGGHFYQFYKNAEDYFRVVIPFFNAGLKRDHACLWLVSKDKGCEEAVARAERGIQNFRYYEAMEQIKILPAEEWYLENQGFSEQKVFQAVEVYLREIQRKGFRCARVCGDAATIPKEEWHCFHEYESKINGLLNGLPLIGLCTYPILQCSLEDTRRVIVNHMDVLVGLD